MRHSSWNIRTNAEQRNSRVSPQWPCSDAITNSDQPIWYESRWNQRSIDSTSGEVGGGVFFFRKKLIRLTSWGTCHCCSWPKPNFQLLKVTSALCDLCKPQALKEYFAASTACKINEIASRKSSYETFVVQKNAEYAKGLSACWGLICFSRYSEKLIPHQHHQPIKLLLKIRIMYGVANLNFLRFGEVPT